jgi:subfamily B ATP-binding cassette protein MsbA
LPGSLLAVARLDRRIRLSACAGRAGAVFSPHLSSLPERLRGLIPEPEVRAMAARLWRDFLRPQRLTFALAIACMAIVAAATSAYPLLIREVFDLLGQGDRSAFWVLAVPVLAVVAVRSLALYFQSVLFARATLAAMAGMQRALFGHLVRADLAQAQREPTGTLLTRFTHDVNILRQALGQATAGLVRDLLTVIGLVGAMLYNDWKLTLVALAVYPLAALPIAWVGRRIRQTSEEAQVRVGQVTALLGESLAGLRLVKTYRLEPREDARAGGAFAGLERVNYDLVRARAGLDPMLEVIGGVAVLAVIGVVMFTGGSVGSFMGFVAALLLASQPAAARRYFTLLDEAPRITERPAAHPLQVKAGEVRLDNVELSYGETPALRGVSFTAPAGRTVALVGRSGSGKSSVFNLVPRLHDPQRGRVLIDGVDVADVTLASLRDAIAVVSQESLLFDDTIRANIAFGRPGASDAEVEAAARDAAAHDFITRLPHGYATRVGERGVNLSGGERQRVALARAFLRGAPILLLDEATSALDADSERLVQEALVRLCRGRTTLVIAHRLATVRAADHIVVLEAGRVVEEGTHAALVEAGGLYSEFVRLQFQPGAA